MPLPEMLEKFRPSPTASWAAIILTLTMFGYNSLTTTTSEKAKSAAEHTQMRQDIDTLKSEAVRRQEMDDLKKSVERIESKVDHVLENQHRR